MNEARKYCPAVKINEASDIIMANLETWLEMRRQGAYLRAPITSPEAKRRIKKALQEEARREALRKKTLGGKQQGRRLGRTA